MAGGGRVGVQSQAERPAGGCYCDPGDGDAILHQCLAVEVERSDITDLNQPGA